MTDPLEGGAWPWKAAVTDKTFEELIGTASAAAGDTKPTALPVYLALLAKMRNIFNGTEKAGPTFDADLAKLTEMGTLVRSSSDAIPTGENVSEPAAAAPEVPAPEVPAPEVPAPEVTEAPEAVPEAPEAPEAVPEAPKAPEAPEATPAPEAPKAPEVAPEVPAPEATPPPPPPQPSDTGSSRKTRHRTPKRRRSAKKGGKRLSKKKTGSRK